jgi:hypothetical protein
MVTVMPCDSSTGDLELGAGIFVRFRKGAPRGIPMLMVGYADDHPADCYHMYNPDKDSVVISRDIQ